MWKGEETVPEYWECLSHGFCESHLKEFGKVSSPEESYELQRKTMLYMRLCLLNPFLFEKSYKSKTMQDLASKCSAFPKEGHFSRKTCAPGMKETMILFDSVITYTLCVLSKICCTAGLFKEARQGLNQDNSFSSFIEKIITAKRLTSDEINNFVRTLKTNFEGYDGEFVKEANLMTLLFVRELRSLELTSALSQLEADLKEVPESAIWKNIGNDNCSSEKYKEAVSAYTCAMDLHPYNYIICSNRAQAYLKLNRYDEAELDSRAAVLLCNTWNKGYVNLLSSLLAQNCCAEAQVIAEFAVKNCEHSLSLFKNLKDPEREYFMKAIKKFKEETLRGKSNGFDEVLTEYSTEVATNVLEKDSDIPDLIDSSEESENEVTKEIQTKQVPSNKETNTEKVTEVQTEELVNTDKVQKKTVITQVSEYVLAQMNSSEVQRKKYEDILREGSAAMAEGCGHVAMSKYLMVLKEAKKLPSVLKYKNEDIVHIKYAYGSACIKSGTSEDLQKSISILKEIVEKYPNVTFPAAFYGIGLAYYKMNRFKEALTYLDKVYNFVQKGIHFKTFNWPGTVAVIEETKRNNLQVLIEELQTKCANPPDPLVICLHATCLSNPPIFYTDPDFKGFLTILCSEKCKLCYHPACWKAFKSAHYVSDKEYLNQACITPDCLGVVIKVECTGKDGNLEKVFSSEEWDKRQSNVKQKKTKLKKKPNIKEQHPRKRLSSLTLSSSKSGTPDTPSENANEGTDDKSAKETSPEVAKETHNALLKETSPEVAKETHNALPLTDGEPSLIIRKNPLDKEESIQKAFKSKDRKRSSKKTKISIDEFCGENFSYYNEYQLRLSKLQESKKLVENDHKCWANLCEAEKIPNLDPERPFHIPEELRNDPIILETILNSVDVTPQSDLTKMIKETIYTYLDEMLSYRGPLNINDPVLIQELESFPVEATTVIAENDGFKNFILKSMRFAVVKDYVCVIDDVIKAYDLSSKDCQAKQFCDVGDLDFFENDIPCAKDEGDSLSYLNPSAVEFKSFSHQQQISGDSVAGANFSNDDSSNFLLNVVNQLRQPICKERTLDCGRAALKASSDALSSYTALEQTTKLNLDKDGASTRNVLACDLSTSSGLGAIINKFQELIAWFYSEEFTEENRRQINLTIKPYALSEVPQKQNKCIQATLPQVEMVSVETMKIDEELECTTKANLKLTNENHILTEQKILLEEKLTSNLQLATKTQNKLTNENSSLKNKLEALTLELQNQKKECSHIKAHSESEQKQQKQLLDKSLEETNVLKKDIEKINAKNKNRELHLRELESSVEAYKEEKQLSNTQDIKTKKIIEQLKNDLLQMEQKTHDAELKLLETKKEEFSKRIDYKINEAKEKIKEIHTCISSVQIDQPSFTALFEKLLLDINQYVNNHYNLQKEIEAEFTKSIKEVEKGAWLSDLKPIVMKDLEEIPNYNKILSLNEKMPPYRLPPQAGLPNLSLASLAPGQSLAGQNSTFNVAALKNGLLPMGVGANPLPGNLLSVPPGIQLKKLPAANILPGKSTPATTGTWASAAAKYSSSKPVSETATDVSAPAHETPTLKGRGKEDTVGSEKETTKESKEKVPASSDISRAETTLASNSVTSDAIELDYTISKDKLHNIKNKNSEICGSTRSLASQKVETKNCYTKLLRKLLTKHSHLSHTQLMGYVSRFRKQNNNKLSGLSIDTIVAKVGQIIDSEEADDSNQKGKARPSLLINRKLTSPGEEEEVPKAAPKSWAKADVSRWSEVSDEQQCSICFDEMTTKNVFRIDCGHRFHYRCIKEWLDKNSNCPICRVHVLLPDDYPTLT